MHHPLVSVVISTYNRLEFLKQAVASVEAQDFKNWELLIVDDASEDETWTWLTTRNQPNIRIFKQPENHERSAARNRGLKEARGELIMFLDDDDLLRQNALTNLAKPLVKNKNLVASVGARWKFKAGDYALKIEHPIIYVEKFIWSELLAGWSSISGQNLYRTTVVREVGGYRPDLIICEDRQLWLKVAKLGKVALIPDIVLDYRVHGKQWRPKNIEELREKVFQEFIDSLPATEQPKGNRIRESARLSQSAENEYRKGNYRTAWQSYLKASNVAPELAFSPLTGLPLIRGLVKSILRPMLPK
ncbi:glycosyltransferase family 2 protein [Coleofasciculus sp. E2-BRE-01]|uniref:glycosyltransferase family 2 protein n=1 Tax=Coleofasciculus sp. E2-BRE-01 TaxID=3069524 RepID=UPI0032F4EBBB